jgi:hypothetical protein
MCRSVNPATHKPLYEEKIKLKRPTEILHQKDHTPYVRIAMHDRFLIKLYPAVGVQKLWQTAGGDNLRLRVHGNDFEFAVNDMHPSQGSRRFVALLPRGSSLLNSNCEDNTYIIVPCYRGPSEARWKVGREGVHLRRRIEIGVPGSLGLFFYFINTQAGQSLRRMHTPRLRPRI